MSEKDKPTELEEILRKRNELDTLIDTRFKRPMTILFTDIVGFTSLAEHLTAPEVAELLNHHFALLAGHIEADGGVIDIARLEFRQDRNNWWLYHKDHEIGHWIMEGEFPTLPAVLELLNQDPNRRFWQ